MNAKIRFQSSVATDLDIILSGYENNSGVTSNRVRASIRNTFKLIELFPEMYAIAFDDIRAVKTEKYPILIQYRVVDKIPVIVSVVFSGAP